MVTWGSPILGNLQIMNKSQLIQFCWLNHHQITMVTTGDPLHAGDRGLVH